MKNTFLGMWPKRQAICNATNLPSFGSVESARAYFRDYCADGQIIDKVEPCWSCGGLHVYSHAREMSGSSSGSGTRQETKKLPTDVQETARRLSARDAGRE